MRQGTYKKCSFTKIYKTKKIKKPYKCNVCDIFALKNTRKKILIKFIL